jgi:gamma-glutamylcyclotransferase (GGCT)/AIG2-like uncharacterized protein YtfP
MEDSERSELVFVYGSLRRGAPEEYHMVDAEFVSPALVQGQLYKIADSPALVTAASGGHVLGDLYRTTPAMLEEIAGIELPGDREGSSTRKILAKVWPYNLGQEEIDAWLWEWCGPVQGAHLVKERDWLEHCIPRQSPLLTIVAICCLLALPAGLVVEVLVAISRTRPSGAIAFGVTVIMILSMLSPFGGLAALFLADRRRERWQICRPMLYMFLGVATIPALLSVLNLFFALLRSLP